MMSRETLEFFNELLERVTLPASAPNFEEQASRVSRVRRELAEAMAALTPEDNNPKTTKTA
jgi:hypothetical protein